MINSQFCRFNGFPRIEFYWFCQNSMAKFMRRSCNWKMYYLLPKYYELAFCMSNFHKKISSMLLESQILFFEFSWISPFFLFLWLHCLPPHSTLSLIVNVFIAFYLYGFHALIGKLFDLFFLYFHVNDSNPRKIFVGRKFEKIFSVLLDWFMNKRVNLFWDIDFTYKLLFEYSAFGGVGGRKYIIKTKPS